MRHRGASVVTSTTPWGRARCDHAMARGPHKSAHEDAEFVCTEILDFCKQGYWAGLPYTAVRDWKNLRISPLGVVPQRNRRPRLIVDYTFSAVNNDTVPLAPREAMQFGRALQRVMKTIVRANPRYGPVHMAKIDIADGFYRVWLQLSDIPKLGVVLPTAPGSPLLVAFPLALPMGWIESPPFFTALSETACDLANSALRDRDLRPRSSVHRLEAVAATPPPESVTASIAAPTATAHPLPPPMTGGPPVAAVDVDVDDSLLLAQTANQRTTVLRAALNAINQVFRPLEPGDPEHRKEPASVKKMLQGDASWATSKRILGWDIDTISTTLHLPPHRLARLRDLLQHLRPPKKRVPVKLWHRLLGELRSMSPALPGTRGLFSALQDALGKADRHRVRITRQVWDLAADFTAIADTLQQRPTRLQELVPTVPSFIGASDASRGGMGGVWFSTNAATPQPPVLWRQAFPASVHRELVTFDHPSGTISISDLELAAMIAHKNVLAAYSNVAEKTMWLATDNRAALARSTKGSSTSIGPRSYLLRYNGFHQRAHRYVAVHDHIAGVANVMADDASRLWHLSDDALLTHFTDSYPQALPWELRYLHPATNSALIGSLFRKRPSSAYAINAAGPPMPPGNCGRHSVAASPSTSPIFPPTPSLSSKSLHSDSATAPSVPAVAGSDLERWKTPYAVWRRRTPAWGPLTLA